MLKIQILKFIAVGLINTTVGYCIYAAFIFLGFNYTNALFIATILGVLFNFQTIGKVVFQNRNNSLIFSFILVYILVFIVNLALIKFFIWLGLNEYLSGALAIIPAAALSFLLNKFFVFKR